ncbi:protein POLYCHOME-like [Pistacia vera]|uniref:protein POLYCHOME-like n=1 Tax=Pistacia vera TaxID=55513 RepID=UPI0012638C34|nr:protein POLYCHOME-like [Pistacia vera]
MSESRDRLVTAVDFATLFAQRRSGTLGIVRDDIATFFAQRRPEQMESPVTQVANTTVARGQRKLIGGGRGGGLGTPRSALGHGRRNVSATRGRSVLPSWYPRRPLGDITAIMRAIERKRARLRETEALQMESPMPQDQRVVDFPEPLSGAQLEHNNSVLSPNPTFHKKHCPPSINQAGEELEFLTPQKKLLNSIDKVGEVVMEELNKLKRTPSARNAEREKRVLTLMSMR